MAPSHDAPLSLGVILFPQFEVLDVAGPLEALNTLSRVGHDAISLSLIARSATAPVSAGPIAPDTLSARCAGQQLWLPTHSFASAPKLDALLVPGGLGALSPTPSGAPADVDDAVQFIRDVFPGLKYLITVCTGAGLAARAGALDGRKATANKRRFRQVAELGRKTEWVGKARWVVDEGTGHGGAEGVQVWSTSGVSSGIDGVVAWIGSIWGDEVAEAVCMRMEYPRRKDPGDDPFAEENGIVDIPRRE